MIISRKHKYIFVGIPFSGSTAISRELCLLYDGEPIVTKHANIQMLFGSGIDLSSYRVAAVLRNPVEFMKTYYHKLKNPPAGYYVDPVYNIENGGHIRQQDRERYAVVQARNLTFSQFIAKYYRLPYDTFFSLNKPYLDYVIRFADLNSSFREFLGQCGIEPLRDLPVLNKSDSKESGESGEDAIPLSFRPFIYEHKDLLQIDIEKPCLPYYQFYRLLKPLRFAHWNRVDRKRPIEKYGTYYELVNQSVSRKDA
ncbi:MAG: hypothetical protein H6988_06800 [Pseudomonadales bacterium]|nr:hypothetical protein [Halieaceae bacterium]MCP5190089.1 hypothetical protein [Pseudomonadales bacterium]